MKFFLQRDGRTYGPYSYDDLKRYQAENRIGPTDQVRREDSQQWEPWQQVLNPAAPPAAPAMPHIQPGYGGYTPPAAPQPHQPAFGQPPQGFGGQPQAFGNNPPAFGGGGFGQPPAEQGFGGGGFGQPQQPQGSDVPGAFGAFGAQGGFGGPPQGQPGGFGMQQGGQPGGFGGQPMGPQGGYGGGGAVGPMPPDMQWFVVLIIGMLTCGVFLYFWMFKQSSFVARLDPQSDAKKFYTFGVILYFVGFCLVFIGSFILAATGSESAAIIPMFANLILVGGFVCIIIARFKMRASVHNYYTMVEPMGINLMDTAGAVLTFFFGELFIQYHFANIAARKKAMGHPAV